MPLRPMHEETCRVVQELLRRAQISLLSEKGGEYFVSYTSLCSAEEEIAKAHELIKTLVGKEKS